MEIKFDEARLERVRAAAEKCPQTKAALMEILPEAFDVPHKFKVGDRVTYRNPGSLPDGLSGTVRDYDGSFVGVEFSQLGRIWHCSESKLSLEEKWEDVTDELRFRAQWVSTDDGDDDTEILAVACNAGYPFKVIVRPRHANLYKIENGRAYHRVTP